METDTTPVSVLPPLYARWIEQLLGSPIPPETEATCADCAMARPDGDGARMGQQYFRTEIKCCSYMPNMPNFLVGQALSDSSLAVSGRVTLERRIASGLAVTPLGLDTGALDNLIYKRSKSTSFGISQRLLCPHFLTDVGRCGVWRHRNSVCSTYFCKYVRGVVGQRFWQSLLQLLQELEEGLAFWCLSELGMDITALRRLFPYESSDELPHLEPAEVDEVADISKNRAFWGSWFGREQQFYLECNRLVNRMDWREAARVCGPRVTLFARLAQADFAELLCEEIPEKLRVGTFNVWDLSMERCCITGYSDRDSLNVPRILLGVLPHFNGQPWPEAIKTIEQEDGILLDRSLVRKLVDFKILVQGAKD